MPITVRLPDFFRDAACAGDPRPAAWTATEPVRGSGSWRTPENLRAIAVCGGCPIRLRCLSWALEQESSGTRHEELDVVLGGLTPPDRRKVRARTADGRWIDSALRADGDDGADTGRDEAAR